MLVPSLNATAASSIIFSPMESYQIGNCCGNADPGAYPACMAHQIGDAVFVGDTLFMPDGGTARADFPGGDARVLYNRSSASFPPDATYFCLS